MLLQDSKGIFDLGNHLGQDIVGLRTRYRKEDPR